jgi:hypothetical protein
MKTYNLNGGNAFNSPGVKNNSENNDQSNSGENVQSVSQSSVEIDDSDNWYNESSI